VSGGQTDLLVLQLIEQSVFSLVESAEGVDLVLVFAPHLDFFPACGSLIGLGKLPTHGETGTWGLRDPWKLTI
jgi:hypothetical protein